ncbi:MAG: phosphoribosylformylglycinamidine synthase [Clostridia bacterium]
MIEKIRRIYVEKRAGFDVSAKALLNDIKTQLNIQTLNCVRIFHRYDVTNLTDAEFDMAVKYVFSEPNADEVYDIPEFGESLVFARELLPGQYDQRADSAEQCIKMIAAGAMPIVRCSTVFALYGEISEGEFELIKSYLINPVEARTGTLEEKLTLTMEAETPKDVESITGFAYFSVANMRELIKRMGLAMSIDDAMFVGEYFKSIGREPTVTEIKVIDTYWSDHCRHTTFLTRIKDVCFEKGGLNDRIKSVYLGYLRDREELYGEKIKRKPICLMDIATVPGKLLKSRKVLNNLDISEEINACSIEVQADVDGKKEPYLLMFKNETHNHPTEIEPFGGAATCLGGAIRDPLSGRAYVHQAMRITGAGDPRTSFSDTIKGKLPQRAITTGAANGYSSYGNQIGLATGCVHEFYHKGYVAKRMEIGVVIAAAKKENVVREKPIPGDAVLLVGGRTGRDGCGGATGSSKAHTEDSILNCGAEVQKGNPLTERKIQRLFRNETAAKLIKCCNDFGAGGVSVAVGELADGLLIDLDKVRKKYDGLDGTEIAISESQERMAVVVSKENVLKFKELAELENLECTEIAAVTDDAMMTMLWRGKKIVELSREFLDTNGVLGEQNIRVNARICDEKAETNSGLLKEKWLLSLKDIKSSSQRGLVERFDSTIGAYTVLMPFAGVRQLTPIQSMAARLPLRYGTTNTGSITTFGFDPEISTKSPFLGAIFAVVESIIKTACAGGDIGEARLTFQEYFEKLYTDESRWSKPFSALLGAYLAQINLNIASIGGKDSMSGTFLDINVPPTLVSFAVTPTDMRNVISCEFKRAGNALYLVRLPVDADGVVNFAAVLKLCHTITASISAKKILSAYSLGAEPLATAIAKSTFGNNIGVNLIGNENLFNTEHQGVMFELSGEQPMPFELIELGAKQIGQLTDDADIRVNGDIVFTLSEALDAYNEPLESVFPVKPYSDVEDITTLSFKKRSIVSPTVSYAKPRVVIPVFPGTNCEVESENAFLRAGARVETVVIRNTKKSDIEASILELKKKLASAEILMLPGGFSAGDEPDGSGKFIAATFREARLRDAVNELLNARDGLILGICNGFQTLIKLGLLPYGEIRETEEDAPTLTFNKIGRHQSRIVRTRVASVLSPWFSALNVGDVFSVPISHGEGRFVCEKSIFNKLVKHGQIATQYVDLDGNPSMNPDFNPAGSFSAIEGITSLDGRILGKMGHTERYSDGLYTNVPGNYDTSIFLSGVKYFS